MRLQSETHQALDEGLQLLLGLAYSFLRAHHSDQLLVLILGRGEDDPGPCAVTHLTDVSATLSNEELVVLRLSPQLSGVAFCLLEN